MIRPRQLLKLLTGQFSHLKKAVHVNTKWYGNNYGGFYVCPDFLNENSIVYSFGIGEDISFDLAMIEKHGCQVFGFDPTPKSINWLKKQHKPSNFTFFEYGIANKSGLVDFFLPKNSEHVSGSFVLQNNVNNKQKVLVEMKLFSDIINELGHNQIDILKIDIEGAEYDILESILGCPVVINQILIEFHDRLFEEGKEKTMAAIKKLNSYGYEIFGISDSFEEVSFINKRLL